MFELEYQSWFLSQNVSQVVIVYACIQKDSIPISEEGASCGNENLLTANSTVATDMVSDTLYLPYPEAGTWYISMQVECYDNV